MLQGHRLKENKNLAEQPLPLCCFTKIKCNNTHQGGRIKKKKKKGILYS